MAERLILDTDIGDDIDDAYCLSLILSSPELALEGVVTVHGPVDRRAQIAHRLLRIAGRDEVPVLPGLAGGGDPEAVPNQHPWAQDEQAAGGDGVAFMLQAILESPGEISLLAVGALTNVAALLEADPGAAGALRRVVVMGGSVYRGYRDEGTPVAEYNIGCDPAAARVVFERAPHLYLGPLDITASARLRPQHLQVIAASPRPLARAMTQLLPYWQAGDTGRRPCLHDPLVAALIIEPSFARGRPLRIEVSDEGRTLPVEGDPNALVYLEADLEPFFEFFVRRLAG